MGGVWGLQGGSRGGVLSRSYAVSAPADRDASQLYYSCLIISVGGKGGGGGIWGMHGEGGGVALLGVWWWVGGGGGIPVYTMQLGSSRHPRALRVRSTIQLTSIVTKGMTKSSEIDDDDAVQGPEQGCIHACQPAVGVGRSYCQCHCRPRAIRRYPGEHA